MTFQDIQKITWGIADLIRDEGTGETTDYMKVGLPLIFLKRFLDVRNEYVEKTLRDSITFKRTKDIIQTIEKEGKLFKIYQTKPTYENWYLLTWEDIVNFKDRDSASNFEIILSSDKSKSIKTTAQTRQQFMEEILNSFANQELYKIFEESEFSTKIKNEKQLPSTTFKKLINILSKADFSYEKAPSDIFSDAYMDLIEKFAEGAGKKGGEFFTPRSLCEGVVSLLDPSMPEKGTLKVCDITVGSATFLTVLLDYIETKLMEEKGMTSDQAKKELQNRAKLYLQEKTAFSLIMGEMNLLLKGFDAFEAYNANSITEYSDNIGKHRGEMDYFVGNPPYGLNDYGIANHFGKAAAFAGKKQVFNDNANEERWEVGIPKKGEGEFAFMNTFMDMIHEKGKGALVLPLGTLFKDSTKDIRKEYIERDWVEGLILLPDNMFTTTGIPVVIWILNKNKSEKDKNKVFMINASNAFVKEGKFKVWEKETSATIYSDRRPTVDYADYISLETLRENDYNLSVQRYVFKEVPEEVIDINELLTESFELETEISEKKTELDGFFSQINGMRG